MDSLSIQFQKEIQLAEWKQEVRNKFQTQLRQLKSQSPVQYPFQPRRLAFARIQILLEFYPLHRPIGTDFLDPPSDTYPTNCSFGA